LSGRGSLGTVLSTRWMTAFTSVPGYARAPNWLNLIEPVAFQLK